MRGSNVTNNFSIQSHLENRDRKNKSVDENSVLGSKRITVADGQRAPVLRTGNGRFRTARPWWKAYSPRSSKNTYFFDRELAGKDHKEIEDSRKLRDPERYALLLLLLYTKGATSFSDLKTTKDDNGIPTVHDTFVEAAKAQCLLSDDAVVIKSLEEMAAYHMPAQLRAAFSAILAFSEIGDTQTLWNLFKKDMSEDFLNRGYDQEESEARAYYEIDVRLVRLGKSMDTFTTAPTIVIDNSTDNFVDLDFHRAKGDQLYATLNLRQKEFCDVVISAATDFTRTSVP
uniref:Uncharacterized protein n=1 Tax=Caenorhabditis japonica TaxID=281687 RepID=A0A8R1E611_CAEJA